MFAPLSLQGTLGPITEMSPATYYSTPSLTWTGIDFVMAWTGMTSSSNYDVYFTRIGEWDMDGEGILDYIGCPCGQGEKAMKPIARGVFQVGGAELTDGRDAGAFLVADSGEAVLIDAGAGVRPERILARIAEAGVTAAAVKRIILTHSHIDHTGGAAWLARELGADLVAHARCADILAVGDDPRTAASWYGLDLPPLRVDQPFGGAEHRVPVGSLELVCLYTPGHSPCSISVFVDLPGAAPGAPSDPTAEPVRPAGALRVLFGQDVHGPIHPTLESDRELYAQSLGRLLALRADVLCEGHFGVFRPAAEVQDYILSYLE